MIPWWIAPVALFVGFAIGYFLLGLATNSARSEKRIEMMQRDHWKREGAYE